jgi:hypothetical protein
MRHIILALLVALPTALVTWVITRGVYDHPGSRCAECPTPETAAIAAKQDPDAMLRDLFAPPLGEFQINGAMELYDPQGLFDYINGAAPLYIERNFRKLAAAEMSVAGGELTCDVYDMAARENAAAVFEAESTPTAQPAELGDAGRSGSMALVFRKDRYYVKLTAFDPDAESALPTLANLLLERMQ